MIDHKVFQVVGVNGYRSQWMTREEALAHAARMQERMRLAGWAGKVCVFYRDGSEVR